ncbi:MAG: Fic family protein [Aliidiomarina sp.]|uniref:Fic family protein n=1 Tax=Aliidiomarina sp. TaxID=1872439 RepID=UPI0025BEEE0B|nr:Fic family protein [Aliidiomarina sp.]MCH8502256.1 Fic family protein [Aliidiomarina sp.]
MAYSPPFKLNTAILNHVANISILVGSWVVKEQRQQPSLRRENRIKTIQASLAVEQNTLSLEQVTAVLEGKRVLGPPREIQEVLNAFQAYEALLNWQPQSLQDLCAAHQLMMQGLLAEAGRWRCGGAGIYRGDQLVHMAPPANQVPRLMNQLVDWLATTKVHPLVASAAFHYEFEFIHPFADGNGRLGRLWQTLILSKWQPLFAYLPVESVIKDSQTEYYQALRDADQKSDCTQFIEYMLAAIATALENAIDADTTVRELAPEMRVETRVEMRVKTPDAILSLLQESPTHSLAWVAQQLGVATSTVERAVAKLQQDKKLKRIGPRKGGSWQVL